MTGVNKRNELIQLIQLIKLEYATFTPAPSEWQTLTFFRGGNNIFTPLPNPLPQGAREQYIYPAERVGKTT